MTAHSAVPTILNFDGLTPPPAWPAVSLCMIVKNEEATLTDCLQAVADFPAEIIVVDTGSTDRTVEIARRFGARVEHFAWIDDFAAARNESLKYAAGEWVFWLDADDRLSAQNLIRLKQAAASGLADVYTCRVTGDAAENEQVQTTAYHFRLFRNHMGLKFVYPLHEDLALVQATGPVTVAHTTIEIRHIGYNISPELFRAKTERNLQIIRRCVQANPANMRWQHHLGLSLTILGRHAEAVQALEQVVARQGQGVNEADLYYTFTNLAASYVKLGQPHRAETVLQQALARFPQRQHLMIAAAMFYLDLDRPEAALPWLERAAQTPAEAVGVQGQQWQPGVLESTLGLAYLLLGQEARAQIAYRAAPAGPDAAALRRQAQANWQARRWERVVDGLGRALGLAGGGPDDWVNLAAAVLLKSGHTASAQRLCQRALAHHPDHQPAADLLALLTQPPGGFWPVLASVVESMVAQPQNSDHAELWQQIAGLFRLSAAELLRQLGLQQINRQENEAAVQTFGLLVELAPAQAEAYKLLGVVLQRLGYQEEAVAAWQMSQQLTVNP
jgi:tetratricopeptide (TPR) repeat protein